jgi:hypothetical protein
MKNYDQLSIKHDEILSFSPSIGIAIIVITRWNDEKSRMFLRKTILGSAQHYIITNVKLLFVFGIPKNSKESERDNILNEQEQYHDMIIPGES